MAICLIHVYVYVHFNIIQMEVPVQFAGVVGFTPPTPRPIPPSGSAGPSSETQTTAGSSTNAEMQQEGGLAEHAVVGLVLTGLLVIVVGAMVLIGFAAYSGVKTVRHDTRNVKMSVARSTNLIAVRAASVAAAEEGSSGLGSKRQSKLSLNVIGTDSGSVAMTTTSVSVDVHPTGEQSTTL